MHPQTRQHLITAMREAAFTFARYRLCAVQARHHGHQELDELFDETATQAYFDHFTKEALLAGLIGTNAENLHDLIRQEQRQATKTYRTFPSKPTPSATPRPPAASGREGEQERARRQRLLTAMRNLDPADPAE